MCLLLQLRLRQLLLLLLLLLLPLLPLLLLLLLDFMWLFHSTWLVLSGEVVQPLLLALLLLGLMRLRCSGLLVLRDKAVHVCQRQQQRRCLPFLLLLMLWRLPLYSR